MCGLPNCATSPRSSPGDFRNHFRSGLGIENVMSVRGAMMMRSTTAGGRTYVSVVEQLVVARTAVAVLRGERMCISVRAGDGGEDGASHCARQCM